jgi:hypothetical protein
MSFRMDELGEYCTPASFRLPGFGGAGVFLQTGVVPVSAEHADDVAALGLDVGLLSPGRFVQFLSRRAKPGFSQELSSFFFAAADDWAPEQSVPAFIDPLSGLTCRVLSSTPGQVGLLVELEDDSVGDPDVRALDFVSSRAVLAQAAMDIRSLEGVDDDVHFSPPPEGR